MLRRGPTLLRQSAVLSDVSIQKKKRAVPELQMAASKPKQCQNVPAAKGHIWMNHFHFDAGHCLRED